MSERTIRAFASAGKTRIGSGAEAREAIHDVKRALKTLRKFLAPDSETIHKAAFDEVEDAVTLRANLQPSRILSHFVTNRDQKPHRATSFRDFATLDIRPGRLCREWLAGEQNALAFGA